MGRAWTSYAGAAVLCAALAPGAGSADRSRMSIHADGTSFSLRFTLDRPAHPLVLHVDPLGRVALVHPPPDVDTLEAAPAGPIIVVPDPESARTWTLSGDPGYETFIVAASGDGHIDLVSLAADARALAEATIPEGREAVVAAVEVFLAERVGPTRSSTILHLP